MPRTCLPHKLTVGSLFSGIGGFDLGMERVGFEIIWQCEIDKFCQRVLKKHWPNVRIYNDVKEINKSNTISPDVIMGGFPCQPFSVAGKRRGKEDDRYLWPEMLRVIQELKPTWVFAENVPGILHIDNGMVFESVLSSLEIEGYEVTSFIIPACAVDAPHRRDRVWILAYSYEQHGYRSGFYAGEIPQQKTTEIFRVRKWPSESGICRVANGIPNRKNRLEALGNAVVPQLVKMIGKCILTSASSRPADAGG